MWVLWNSHDSKLNMQAIKTIGLGIANSIFQVHGIDEAHNAVVRRQLKRRYVLAVFQKLASCLVGIEACHRHTVDRASFRRLAIRCG